MYLANDTSPRPCTRRPPAVYGQHCFRPGREDRPGDEDDAHRGQLAGLPHRRHVLVAADLVLRRRLHRGDVDPRAAAHTDKGGSDAAGRRYFVFRLVVAADCDVAVAVIW